MEGSAGLAVFLEFADLFVGKFTKLNLITDSLLLTSRHFSRQIFSTPDKFVDKYKIHPQLFMDFICYLNLHVNLSNDRFHA